MFRTLYAKLAVALLLLLAIVGVLTIYLTLFATAKHVQEVHQSLNRDLAEHLVSEKLLMVDGQVNETVLKDVFHMLMVINPTIELYLLNPEGELLAYSAPPGTVKRAAVSLDPVKRFLAGERLPILGDDPRDLEGQKVFSVSPIRLASEDSDVATVPTQGYLYIVLGGQQFDSASQMLRASYVLRLSTGVGVLGLAFALLTGLLVFWLLTRRLRVLSALMDRFRKDDFTTPVSFPPGMFGSDGGASGHAGDEVDELANSFDQMAERITEQIARLDQTDQLRRELVANVSHDLRTPLASLHGYLETLSLKADALSEAERRQYLSIALRHSERLGKLVGELFELAKLDSQESPIAFESFSMPELVQDVVQEFQLFAKQKEVSIHADLKGKLPQVRADIHMMERVLENLLENALRYTPAGGRIEVAVTPEGDTVRVVVADTGQGINPDDIPHIFDRFYQGQPTAPVQSGSGLGLAITKRILDLHHSTIRAQCSAEGGTRFVFNLPAAGPA